MGQTLLRPWSNATEPFGAGADRRCGSMSSVAYERPNRGQVAMTKTAMVAGSREGHAETSSCVSKTNYRALVFCHSQHAHVPLVLHGISRRCILIEQLQRIQ